MATRPDSPRSLRRVAVHEAGHALIAILNEFRVGLVTITRTKDELGSVEHSVPRCIYGMDIEVNPRSERRARGLVKVCLAGHIAERLQYGPRIRSKGCLDDFTEATKWATALAEGNPAVSQKWLDLLFCQTEYELAHPLNWGWLNSVVDMLVLKGTISGRQVRGLLSGKRIFASPPFAPEGMIG